MRPDRKNTKTILIDLGYKGSANEFEEFYGYTVTYQELEQQSYIEFKSTMFEQINKKIKFRKDSRVGPILTIKANMYEKEIEKFEELINNNKIETIYGWVVKDVTLITDKEEKAKKEFSYEDELESDSFENESIIETEDLDNVDINSDID